MDILHELEPCVLQSELGILVAPKTHGKSLIPKNFTQIVVSSSCYVAETFSEPFLAPKSKLSSQANFRCIYIGQLTRRLNWLGKSIESHLVKPFLF